MTQEKHNFGGHWTEAKLAILRAYLGAYSKALKNKNFTLHYADAFAGTGSISKMLDEGPDIISLMPLEPGEDEIKGSAAIALESDGFAKYHFNDLDPRHIRALEHIKSGHPEKDIRITQLDANDFVKRFCQQLTGWDRGVIFIDPYAAELDWESLVTLAKTKKVDVWLLFPFATLLRILPKDKSKMPENWEPRVDRMLGTKEWKRALYRRQEGEMVDLFGNSTEYPERRVDMLGLTDYLTERLRNLFCYTSQPIILRNSKRSPMFYFYFAMNNDSEKAMDLARKLVNGVLKNTQLMV